MYFCKHCGKRLDEGAKFCKHCGAQVELVNASNSEKPEMEKEVEIQHTQTSDKFDKGLADVKSVSGTSKKISKQTKQIISIVGAIILFMFIGYKVGESFTSYENIIEDFKTAILEENADKVAGMLIASNENITIDSDSVKGFIRYYIENPSELDVVIDHLKSQGYGYENNPNVSEAISDSALYYNVNLAKNGKTFIYDNYDIKVSPVYFNVNTNFKNTKILVDDEVIATAEEDDFSKKVGPFLPGIYTFGASYESDIAGLLKETDSTNLEPEQTNDVDLNFNAQEVSINVSNLDHLSNVKLYLDGKDSGINLLEQNKIGPIRTNGSMSVYAEAEFPWGVVRTEELPIEAGFVNLAFTSNETVIKVMKDSIIQFNREFMKASTMIDATEFTIATDDVVEDVIEEATFKKEHNHSYKGKFIGVDFCMNSFQLSKNNGKWYAHMDTKTLFEDDSFFDTIDEAELMLSKREYGYDLVYDKESDTWLVTTVDFAEFLDGSMVEYREPEPKTYVSNWFE